jgi:hypothetical protein
MPEMRTNQPQNAAGLGVDTNSLPYRQIPRRGPVHLVFRGGFAPDADRSRPNRKPMVASPARIALNFNSRAQSDAGHA